MSGLVSMNIDYDHALNLHSLAGPQAAVPIMFENEKPASLLDVGCGTGTWLKAALDYGIGDVLGVDGAAIPPEKLHVPGGKIHRQDLTRSWDLKRKFAAIICFEVAEHLEGDAAPVLVDALVRHGRLIYFCAACPGQGGQHHVNCQWPTYWQKLFNERGYVCDDTVRWRIWELGAVEPWYRQNMMTARYDPPHAGQEPRIPGVIHPQMLETLQHEFARLALSKYSKHVEHGSLAAGWYLKVPIGALWEKARRKLG